MAYPARMDSNGSPRCPNHGVELQDCQDGIGICPVSNERFAYKKVEEKKKKKTKYVMKNGELVEVEVTEEVPNAT